MLTLWADTRTKQIHFSPDATDPRCITQQDCTRSTVTHSRQHRSPEHQQSSNQGYLEDRQVNQPKCKAYWCYSVCIWMQDGAHLTPKKTTLSEVFHRNIPGEERKISVNYTKRFLPPWKQWVNTLAVLIGSDFSFRLQADTRSPASTSKRSSSTFSKGQTKLKVPGYFCWLSQSSWGFSTCLPTSSPQPHRDPDSAVSPTAPPLNCATCGVKLQMNAQNLWTDQGRNEQPGSAVWDCSWGDRGSPSCQLTKVII